jgi:hypothetical protein
MKEFLNLDEAIGRNWDTALGGGGRAFVLVKQGEYPPLCSTRTSATACMLLLLMARHIVGPGIRLCAA